jgi:hypothetical protein
MDGSGVKVWNEKISFLRLILHFLLNKRKTSLVFQQGETAPCFRCCDRRGKTLQLFNLFKKELRWKVVWLKGEWTSRVREKDIIVQVTKEDQPKGMKKEVKEGWIGLFPAVLLHENLLLRRRRNKTQEGGGQIVWCYNDSSKTTTTNAAPSTVKTDWLPVSSHFDLGKEAACRNFSFVL